MKSETQQAAVTINGLKRFLIEKLWFVLLLTPLFVIVVFILQNVTFNQTQSSSRSIVAVGGTVEISAVELAAIVSAPFAELLAMEVYPSSQGRFKNASFASNARSGFIRKAGSRQTANTAVIKQVSAVYLAFQQQKAEDKS